MNVNVNIKHVADGKSLKNLRNKLLTSNFHGDKIINVDCDKC